MKKRLFISSILMTLVLLVAITTATFAWYSAASFSAPAAKTANLATTKNTVEAANIQLDMELKFYSFSNAQITENPLLLPATNNDQTGSTLTGITQANELTQTWKSFVKTGATTYVNDSNSQTGKAAYAIAKFTLTGDANYNDSLGSLSIAFDLQDIDVVTYAVEDTSQANPIHHVVPMNVLFAQETTNNNNQVHAYTALTADKTVSNLDINDTHVFYVMFWIKGESVTDDTLTIAANNAQPLITATVSYVTK